LFFKLLPDVKVVIDSIKKTDSDADPIDCDEVVLFYAIKKLFDECLNEVDYDMDDVQLGHTYFLRHKATISAEEQMKYDLNKIDTIIRSKLCHQNNYVGEDEGHSIQHDISLKYNLAKCIQEARIRECQGTQEYIEPKTEWAMLRFGSLVLTQKRPSVKVPKPRNRKNDGDNTK
jgi:hypothetical protein